MIVPTNYRRKNALRLSPLSSSAEGGLQREKANGGGIGATSGAMIGGIADPGRNGEYRTRNIILGSAIGGMAGMIAGQQFF